MKKRCKYCNGIIKIKEEEIENIKDNGRGVLCDLCGAFIEIPKKIDDNVRPNNYYNGRYRNSYKKKKREQYIIAGLILIIFNIFFIPYFIFCDPLGYGNVPQQVKTESTFIFICNTTGNDMSSEIKMSIWEPKVGIEFEYENDLYNLSKYQLLIDSKLPINISIDLRHLSYYLLVEINPNSLHINYTNDYYIINYGINYNYVFWAYYIGDL